MSKHIISRSGCYYSDELPYRFFHTDDCSCDEEVDEYMQYRDYGSGGRGADQ